MSPLSKRNLSINYSGCLIKSFIWLFDFLMESPLARALLKAREGGTVTLRTPGGGEEIEIIEVRYVTLNTH